MKRADAIRSLEATRRDALVARDEATLRSLLHSDLIYVHSDGATDDLESYIAAIVSGKLIYHPDIKITPLEIIPVGDVIVVRGTLSGRITLQGVDRLLSSRTVGVWTGDDGHCRLMRFESLAAAMD